MNPVANQRAIIDRRALDARISEFATELGDKARMPVVTIREGEYTPATFNTEALSRRTLALFQQQGLLASQLARLSSGRAAVQHEAGRQERRRDDGDADPGGALEEDVQEQRE